jgi:hypothetical protein
MFSAIRPSHRRATPIARLVAALPAVPHRHKKRGLHMGTGAILRPILAALLIGISAVIFRDKLASIVSRGHGAEEQAAEEQAPDAAEE